MKKIITTACVFIFSVSLSAQEKVYTGSFKAASMVGPMMDYWDNPNTLKSFANILDSILYSQTKIRLAEPEKIFFEKIDPKQIYTSKLKPLPNISSFNFRIIEYSPAFLLTTAPPTTKEDSAFLNGVISCIQMSLLLTDRTGATKIEKDIEIYLKKGISNGIGLPIANLALSQKGLLELIEKSLPHLLNPNDSLQSLEMKVSGLFASDNFILAANVGKPRIQINIKKNSAIYSLGGETQIIRWNPPGYQEIIESGKNKTQLNDSLAAEIKNEKKNSSPIFIYLKQSLRDAVHNKNYEIVMPAKFWNEVNTGTFGQTTLAALQGAHHRIMEDKDTIGYFSISKGGTDSNKSFYTNSISNGIDTSSITNIIQTPNKVPVEYDYVVKGTIYKHNFIVKIYGYQYIREIWIDDTLVATVFGDIEPEKFVLANTFDNTPLLNCMILFSYHSYFSSKSLTRLYSAGMQLRFSEYFPLFPLPESYNFYPRVEYHYNN